MSGYAPGFDKKVIFVYCLRNYLKIIIGIKSENLQIFTYFNLLTFNLSSQAHQ
jgi:hypothetical protein